MSKPIITDSQKSPKKGWKVPKHETNHEADIDSVVLDGAGEIVMSEENPKLYKRRMLHVLKTAEGMFIDGRLVESPNLRSFFYSDSAKVKVAFADGSMWIHSSALKEIAYMRTRENEQPCEMCKTEGLTQGDICPACGGAGYMVDTILDKDGATKAYRCAACANEGRTRSFMVNTGVTFHRVTAMRVVLTEDEMDYEDYETVAPYVHFRCAWGHHDTDGY